MRVLIIPEDSRRDKDILKPLFESLFRSIGKPKARIQVCEDPVLGGVEEALKSERIEEIVDDNEGMTDIFILCVDRDGNTNRCQRLNRIESEFAEDGRTFFAEHAWEEIETWVLAGLDLPTDWNWADIRREVSVKERYFEPFASQRGVFDTPAVVANLLQKRLPATFLRSAGNAPKISTLWLSGWKLTSKAIETGHYDQTPNTFSSWTSLCDLRR